MRPVRIPGVRVIRETDKAILCDIDGDEVWVPQSQVHEDSEVWKQGDSGTLAITEWLASKLGYG